MAKPNYSFEKRQRELAKKKKKEEKLKEKTERKHVGEGGQELAADEAVEGSVAEGGGDESSDDQGSAAPTAAT
jgi:hypothetical protein